MEFINFVKKEIDRFSQHIVENYNELNDTNIIIIFRLREIIVKHNDLVCYIFKNKKKYNIKDDINKYSERDNKQGIIKRLFS